MQFIVLGPKAKDITGQQFGKLVAIGPVDKDRYGMRWLCRCDCGKESTVRAAKLIAGEIQSCGCIVGRKCTHGMSYTAIFNTWQGMKDRCFYPNCESYPHYGGRGITVCDEWVNSFEAFYEYVSKLPHFGESGYSIDRIDNDGDYKPDNVRWATVIEQRRNQRNNRFVTIDGITRTAVEWSEISGISSTTIRERLNRGWSEYDAVFKPVRGERWITAKGQTLRLFEWAKLTGISMTTILSRMNDGWSDEDAVTRPLGFRRSDYSNLAIAMGW